MTRPGLASAAPPTSAKAARPSKAQRLGELGLFYVAAPGLIALASAGHRWVVAPTIALGALLSALVLWRDPSYDRRAFWGLAAFRAGLLRLLLRSALALLLLSAGLWAAGAWPAFRMPRERPLVWLGVLALYPLLSAGPQEVMYRTLFFHRYGALFGSETARLVASALLFGWAHVLVHDGLAVLLATAAGGLLALTWRRSRSLLLVGLEHSLYGAFVFTAGVGGMFVNGVRLVSGLTR